MKPINTTYGNVIIENFIIDDKNFEACFAIDKLSEEYEKKVFNALPDRIKERQAELKEINKHYNYTVNDMKVVYSGLNLNIRCDNNTDENGKYLLIGCLSEDEKFECEVIIPVDVSKYMVQLNHAIHTKIMSNFFM